MNHYYQGGYYSILVVLEGADLILLYHIISLASY